MQFGAAQSSARSRGQQKYASLQHTEVRAATARRLFTPIPESVPGGNGDKSANYVPGIPKNSRTSMEAPGIWR